MIGSDDVLACFVAGNIFTVEWVAPSIRDGESSLRLLKRLVPFGDP